MTWDDLKGRPVGRDRYNFKYQLMVGPGKQHRNDTVFHFLKARNVMDPYGSWADRSKVMDADLKYLQLVFNISELHKRDLQCAAFTHPLIQLHQDLRVIQSSSDRMVDELNKSTAHGSDPNAFGAWRTRLDSVLAIPEEELTSYTVRRFSMGMHVGAGTFLFSGEFNDHYTHSWSVNYGFDFAHDRIFLLLRASLGGLQMLSPPTDDVRWRSGHSGFAAADACLGHVIIDTKKWRILPHAGVGVFEVNQRTGPEQEYPILQANTLVAGIITDHKFKKAVRLTPGPYLIGGAQYSELMIRGRFQYSHSIAKEINGGAILLGLEFAFLSRAVRLGA